LAGLLGGLACASRSIAREIQGRKARMNRLIPRGELQMQWIKLGLDIGPLGVFFFVYSQWGIFSATAAFMVCVALALAASFILFRKVALMPLITGAFVMVFGGLTLYLQDDTFIKIKPTIVNLVFAWFLAARLAVGKPILKTMLGEVIQMEDEGWRKLTVRWACFFVALACLNEAVWRNFSRDFWIAFKTFGVMPLTFMFMMAQVGLLQKYQITRATEETSTEERKNSV
jgi:intracellular septation protein